MRGRQMTTDAELVEVWRGDILESRHHQIAMDFNLDKRGGWGIQKLLQVWVPFQVNCFEFLTLFTFNVFGNPKDGERGRPMEILFVV